MWRVGSAIRGSAPLQKGLPPAGHPALVGDSSLSVQTLHFRQQFFSFRLHQRFISTDLNIQANHRFGVGHAQVEAPGVEFYAQAVYVADAFGAGAVEGFYGGEDFGWVGYGAVDFAAGRVGFDSGVDEGRQGLAALAKAFGDE